MLEKILALFLFVTLGCNEPVDKKLLQNDVGSLLKFAPNAAELMGQLDESIVQIHFQDGQIDELTRKEMTSNSDSKPLALRMQEGGSWGIGDQEISFKKSDKTKSPSTEHAEVLFFSGFGNLSTDTLQILYVDSENLIALNSEKELIFVLGASKDSDRKTGLVKNLGFQDKLIGAKVDESGVVYFISPTFLRTGHLDNNLFSQSENIAITILGPSDNIIEATNSRFWLESIDQTTQSLRGVLKYENSYWSSHEITINESKVFPDIDVGTENKIMQAAVEDKSEDVTSPTSEDELMAADDDTTSVEMDPVVPPVVPPEEDPLLPLGKEEVDISMQAIAINSATSAGSHIAEENSYAVTTMSSDIFGSEDSFYYLYSRQEGDLEIRYKITIFDSEKEYAKIGVMFRETLEVNARHTSFFVTPQLEGQGINSKLLTSKRNNSTKIPSENVTKVEKVEIPNLAEYSMRVTLVDGQASMYISTDEVNWELIGDTQLNFAGVYYVGFAFANISSTQFSNFKLEDIHYYR